MLSEISSATAFLATLFTTPLTSEVRETFAASLSQRLRQRYAGNWFEFDGERGSASRALLWHSHGGGEGYDADLASVCLTTVCDQKQLDNVFALPFTLWIDPGCVAVRLGHGPGVYTSGMTVMQHQAASAFKVLHGALPTRPASTPSVRAAVAATALQPPMLALLPSTPALGADADFATTSSSYAMASRSTSSGGCSVLTVGSRVSSGAMSATTDEGDEACPSLVAPSSSRGDSESDFYDDDDEEDDDDLESSSQLSIQDMMERIGFSNIDIIDDDDGDEEEGEGDRTICADEARKSSSVAKYDGGNVGVMGGGVRLGGARTQTSPAAKPRPSSNVWPTAALSGLQSLPMPVSKLAPMYVVGNAIPPSSFAVIDGQLVTAMPPCMDATKRNRSRGRRSRGRGAGRAARRQAAAMLKASQHQQQYYGSDAAQWHAQPFNAVVASSPYHQPIPSSTTPPFYNMQYPNNVHVNAAAYLSAGPMAAAAVAVPQWHAATPIRVAYH